MIKTEEKTTGGSTILVSYINYHMHTYGGEFVQTKHITHVKKHYLTHSEHLNKHTHEHMCAFFNKHI